MNRKKKSKRSTHIIIKTRAKLHMFYLCTCECVYVFACMHVCVIVWLTTSPTCYKLTCFESWQPQTHTHTHTHAFTRSFFPPQSSCRQCLVTFRTCVVIRLLLESETAVALWNAAVRRMQQAFQIINGSPSDVCMCT